MPWALVMSSRTRPTRRLSRTTRATSPTSGRSSSPTQAGTSPTVEAASGGETEAFEAITGDRVAPDELRGLGGVHPGLGAEPPRHVERVRPRAVRVGVVGLEEDLVDADLVAAAQPVEVVEDAAVDAAA